MVTKHILPNRRSHTLVFFGMLHVATGMSYLKSQVFRHVARVSASVPAVLCQFFGFHFALKKKVFYPFL